MSAFIGILTFDGSNQHIDKERIGRPLAARRKGRRPHLRVLDGAVFAQIAEPSEAGHSALPLLSGSDDEHSVFAADAHLDNREELAAALGLSLPELTRTPDSTLILHMYRRWGEAGIARCLGAFVFALWDARARRLVLGRDCLGNRAIFFHHRDNYVAFATVLGDLFGLPGVPREIDEDMMADFLAVDVREPVRTLYRHISRVPSRTIVTIDPAGVRHGHYWSPDFNSPAPYKREVDYIERTRELFDQAVASATSDTPDVAISTSGGLDSSAIAATAARLGQARSITCYTVVPPSDARIDVGPARYADERDKVEALGRLYPKLAFRLFAPETLHPNEVDPFRFFASLGLPSVGTAVLGPYSHLYDAVAAAGHRALLVGNRGNFGVTWRGSHALRVLLRNRQWGRFARELSASTRQGRSMLQTLRSDVVIPALPRGIRRGLYRASGRNPDDVSRYSALNPTYIADRDLPRKWREQGFDPWFVRSDPDPARYRADLLFDANQMARDMRGMNLETQGFDYRDPHGDRRLLEFVLKVPEPMFARDGMPRAFARAVFADRLPPEILTERRRGAQTVTWFRNLNERRLDIAQDLERMEGSALARRLIDLPRLKRLMRDWPADEHAAEKRMDEYRLMLMRAVHAGRFIQWIEGGNS